MKKGIVILPLIFCFSYVFGQKSSKTYLNRKHMYSTTYCYSVNELTIFLDSTYTSKGWCTSKKEWRKYKGLKSEIDSGKVTRKGKYFVLTDYRNGNKTDFSRVAKITDKRVLYFYLNRNNKLEKVAKFKRIKK